jgi:hypothetical protein
MKGIYKHLSFKFKEKSVWEKWYGGINFEFD